MGEPQALRAGVTGTRTLLAWHAGVVVAFLVFDLGFVSDADPPPGCGFCFSPAGGLMVIAMVFGVWALLGSLVVGALTLWIVTAGRPVNGSRALGLGTVAAWVGLLFGAVGLYAALSVANGGRL